MSIELREITEKNFDECIGLKIGEDQNGFVAPNIMSIAQSKVLPNLEIKAVYNGETMVGFVMYGLEPKNGRHYLVRLMIDENHQRKGFGRAATEAVIGRMRDVKKLDSFYLCYVPENTGAAKLYESLGFEKTGEIDEGEIVMRLKF